MFTELKHPWQISAQRTLLEKYAKEKGFENTIFLADDGYSGTNFVRMKEKQFAAYPSSKNTLELRREMNTLQKPCGGAERSCPSCSSGSMRTMCWGG